MLPIFAKQANVTGGTAWQELIVMLTNIAAGLCLIVAWSLLVAGFVKQNATGESGDA
jgi:hydroxylaminobenzene mutase